MRFFRFIGRHPDLSYWLTWLYLFLCLLLLELSPMGAHHTALLLAPANVVSWPLAATLLGNGKWRTLRPRVRGALLLLPGATAVLPLYLLYFF